MLENGNGGSVETGHKTESNTFGGETKNVLGFLSDLTKKLKTKKTVDEVSWFINLPSPLRDLLSKAEDVSLLLHPAFQYVSKGRLIVEDTYNPFKQIANFVQRQGSYLKICRNANSPEGIKFCDTDLVHMNWAKPGDQYDVLFFRTMRPVSISEIDQLNQAYGGVNLGIQGMTLLYASRDVMVPDAWFVGYNETPQDYRIARFFNRGFERPPLDPLEVDSLVVRSHEQKDLPIRNEQYSYVAIYVKI